ncbi:MAG: hypothetical protein ACW96N_00035 [Candidatus Thorarchaeota archaeon]|jgi:hypothetical protein
MSAFLAGYLVGMIGYIVSDVYDLLHHSYCAITKRDLEIRSLERKNTRRSLLNLFRASIRAPFWPLILVVWFMQIGLGILTSMAFWN